MEKIKDAGAKKFMNVIIVAGMPASGKTTFVNKLSKALGYPVLEKDAIKEELPDAPMGVMNMLDAPGLMAKVAALVGDAYRD